MLKNIDLLYIQLQVEPKGSKDRVFIFFKRYPEALTPDNLLSNVFISSMVDSPISTFYHTLKKVFAPVLLTDEKWNKKIDPKLQNLLNDLETGLAVSLQANETLDEVSNPDALSSKIVSYNILIQQVRNFLDFDIIVQVKYL